jgi:choline dehydrogenase-like flavoprotein
VETGAARLRADAVVIGTGAGGGPAAALLAEAGLDVVVLEAGPFVRTGDFSEDELAMRVRLGFVTPSAGGLHSFYAGACVGGSTVVNDALCWRPPPEVLESWQRDHGLAAFSAGAFEPWVERAWNDVHAEATGPALQSPGARALERGAASLGWSGEWMPRSVRGCAGLGRCNLGCPLDAKQSTLVAYVPRALRAGARLEANTRAERVVVGAGAVRGVEGVRVDPATGAAREAFAVDAPLVLLAAGALGSGPLLLRSGVAGAAGRGFQAHTSTYVTARFAEPLRGWLGPTMAYAISEFADVNGHAGPGYMLESGAVRPLQTASVLPGFGAEHERAMAALPHLAHTVVVLRDRVRGALRVDRGGRTRVEYELDAADMGRLRDALSRSATAYLAAGAEEVWLPLQGLPPVRRASDLAALAAFPVDATRFSLLYAVHLFGGAAMGARADTSTCDEEGRVRGVRGLYVCDAAALPSSTGVNPQITILANALRVAAGAAAARGAA